MNRGSGKLQGQLDAILRLSAQPGLHERSECREGDLQPQKRLEGFWHEVPKPDLQERSECREGDLNPRTANRQDFLGLLLHFGFPPALL